jgi:protein TonB
VKSIPELEETSDAPPMPPEAPAPPVPDADVAAGRAGAVPHATAAIARAARRKGMKRERSIPPHDRRATFAGNRLGLGGGRTLQRTPEPGLVASKSTAWSCPFPAEADAAKIDDAVVSILVTVNADGVPVAATVLRDVGYGFGDMACACALRRTYKPALDRSGTPIVSSAVVNVRFSRSPAE